MFDRWRNLFRTARALPGNRSKGRVRPRLESLEERATPALVTFTVDNDWGSGFQGQITLHNDTATPINGWNLSFNFERTITQVWNGDIAASGSGQYTIRNAAWNGNIAPGASVSFGFLGGPGAPPAPTNYLLNGASLGSTLPGISITDVSVLEGNSGATTARFTVTLSKASTSPVTVQFATASGTATSGVDFLAANGLLTFQPGQTSRTIDVAVVGDTLFEPNETLSVNLTNPTGATLVKGIGVGTILNDDVAPLPTLSISDVSVVEGNPGSAAPGYFQTSGNQIVDSQGNTVRIAGVNWFGFETTTSAPHGLHTRNYKDMMDQMKELGFNTIRLPFSNQMLDPGRQASGINYNLNPDLQGLSPIQIMDKIVEYAGEIGLRIFLDNHRSAAGDGPNSNGLWYTSAYPESRWISDWVMLAERYAGNPTVIGADLMNEPHGQATWGDGNLATDWRLAAQRAGNAILAVNPDWLIIVEGIDRGPSGYYWWGGNLSMVATHPVELNVANRLVYSPHDYPASVYQQPWFSAADYPNNLYAVWDANWGYIYREGIAPILIGEFGSRLHTTSDQQWFDAITKYLAGDLNGDGMNDLPAGHQGASWTYWSWNPNSGDTGGILNDDWTTPVTAKVNALQPVQFDLTSSGGATALFTVTLSAPSTQTVTVQYATANGTAQAGSDYVAVSGTLTFLPGQTTKTIAVPILGDLDVEADETFTLTLSSPVSATFARSVATGTIRNDDNVPAPPPIPSLSIGNVTVTEGTNANAVFTVALSAPTTQTVTVNYETVPGAAQAGSDFLTRTGTLTFQPGETVKTISVPIVNDSLNEPTESFSVRLTSPTNATLGVAVGNATILDNDLAPTSPASAQMKVRDNWGTGFVADISVKNTTSTPMNGWLISFDLPYEIVNYWNAELVSREGNRYTFRSLSWNSKLAVNGVATFGFQALGNASIPWSNVVVTPL